MLDYPKLTNRQFVFNNILVCSFFILGFIGIINHELWQDEMQAWMIATDSTSIPDLFKNLKYEGHTALWYLCLRFLNLFADNPFIMQAFHLIIATINIGTFVLFSPFNKLQKVLFTFGYFPFYEYNILSRNYNLGVLFIFCFCALFSTRKTNYIPLSVIVALLAHTNIFGLIIAIALQLTLLLETFVEPNLSFKRWDFIAGFVIVVSSIVAAIIQLRPPTTGVQGNLIAPDTTVWQTIFAQISDLNRLMELISNVWKAYFPIYQFSSSLETVVLISLSIALSAIAFRILIERAAIRFLSIAVSVVLIFILALEPSNLPLEVVNMPALLGSLVSFVILFWFGLLFVRQPIILFLYIAGTLGIFLFTYFIYYSDNLRHTGHFFLLFLICFWLQKSRDINWFFFKDKLELPSIDRYSNQVIIVILSLHLITGIVAYTNDLIRPFSMSKATASYIEQTKLDTLPIMAVPDERVSAIAGYLDREVYYPQSDRWGSFVIWDSKRRNVTAEEIVEPSEERQLIKRNVLQQVDKIVEKNPTDVLLVSTAPINFGIPSLKITSIKQFTYNTIGREKSYRLYLIQKTNN